MTKRFAPVVFAGLALVGCASPAPSEEVAMDQELAQTWQALTVFECQQQNAECIVDAGLDLSDQAACATEFTDCVVLQTAETTEGIVGCGFENVGCSLEGATALDLNSVVDCQQEVVDCVEEQSEALTGVDLTPVADLVDEVVDGTQDAVDDVVDDTVDNVTSQLECNQQAAECLAGNIFDFYAVRQCRIDFVECSAQVVEDVVTDAVEIITGDLDCRQLYLDCRADDGTVSECLSKRRDCENQNGG